MEDKMRGTYESKVDRDRPSLKAQIGETWADTLSLIRGAFGIAKQYWIGFLMLFVLAAIAVIWLIPSDREILAAVRVPRTTTMHQVARQVSFWGDFFTMNMILLGVMLITGLVCRSRKIRIAAVAIFISASFSGVCVNCIRPVVGRPRPKANLPDGFYGPSLDSNYHGFPSGHSGTAFSTAVSSSLVCPPLTVPAIILADAVGWSRLQLNRHHLSDVVAGATIGVFWGLLFGLSGFRLMRRTSTGQP